MLLKISKLSPVYVLQLAAMQSPTTALQPQLQHGPGGAGPLPPSLSSLGVGGSRGTARLILLASGCLNRQQLPLLNLGLDAAPSKRHLVENVTAWRASHFGETLRTEHGSPCPDTTVDENTVRLEEGPHVSSTRFDMS